MSEGNVEKAYRIEVETLTQENERLAKENAAKEEALQMAVTYRYLNSEDLYVCTGCWTKAYGSRSVNHKPGCWMADKTIDSKTGRKLVKE